MTPAPIQAMAGTIFVGNDPVSFVEAMILRDVTAEEFMAARRARDFDALAVASRKEHALRVALHTAAEHRRAAGWTNPAEADRRPASL